EDEGLEASWRLGIETVPTLMRGDRRIVGWSRVQWEELTGVSGLGEGLPDYRPGCGSRTVEPGLTDELAVRFSGSKLHSRRVELAAVQAACTDAFNVHGLPATTYCPGPVVIANGPITGAIGMNSGVNALGQGNRANATIGRALQLVIRNVGGGRPGGVDRATLGNPGKYTFCFAEDEEGSPWEPLSVERGVAESASAVTLFAGEGPRGVVDQASRTPDSLARSLAGCLRTVAHPKLVRDYDA